MHKKKQVLPRVGCKVNMPFEKGVLKFNIRVASPPPGSTDIPPGLMSSWTFNLKPGDKVRVFGQIDKKKLTFLKKGIEIDGVKYKSITAKLDNQQKLCKNTGRPNDFSKSNFWWAKLFKMSL